MFQRQEYNMENKTAKTTLSVIMILLAASGWGLIGVFSRPLSSADISSVQMTFIRSIIVAVGMGLLLLIKDQKLLCIRLKDFWLFLGTGIISIIFFNVCYFSTIGMTTLATASILLYTAPCFVMLMSAVFFKEKITVQKLAALILAFLGCLLVSGFAGGDISLTALIMGIGSGLGYASYSIFGKVALKKYHTFTVIFYTFLVSSAGLLPFAGLPNIITAFAADTHTVFLALGLGIVSTFMPYICYTAGLMHVEAGKASVLAFAEPMVATIAGILLFHEQLHLKNAMGIVLIFLAIVLLNIPLNRNSRKMV